MTVTVDVLHTSRSCDDVVKSSEEAQTYIADAAQSETKQHSSRTVDDDVM